MSKLKMLREIEGLSQGQLSNASGIHTMTISKIERGVIKSSNLTLLTAVKLAKALHCSAEDLLDLDDEN